MRQSKVRFVTACQQLLALGAVLAVLTPAAAVISLDVVGQVPADGRPGAADRAGLSAFSTETRRASVLPAGPVDADVTEYALTSATTNGRVAPSHTVGRVKLDPRTEATQLTTRPVPVSGYAGVGLTWAPDEQLDDGEASFALRTRTGEDWSEWNEVPYHDEHAPDPGSREARQARPGTDLVLVGKVDEVQVRSTVVDTSLPADLELAVTEPGEARRTVRALPALETDQGSSADRLSAESADSAEGDEEVLDLQAAVVTPKPRIYSRKQWGANESLRDRGSLRYFEIHAGFVHHTVNANDYSRSEVPGILRSIYAYHTQSRGWSDVGYNFLVDKFGRIWEGRAGGIDRPVVGAHTLGYNDYAFAMSAIGNFETATPSAAMIEAYGSLMAWKLSLHGVDAGSAKQQVGPDSFRAINGHRDAGSTACPGRNLYSRLGAIRTKAEAAQRGWEGRELQSDLASTTHPDLVVRRASDRQAFIIPTGGLLGFQKGRPAPDVLAGTDLALASPDLTGDGTGDLVVRLANGVARVRPGTATGFGAGIKPTSALAGRDLVTAVGDLDEDGDNDLVGRNPDTGRLFAYLGDGSGAFTRQRLSGDWSGYDLLAATGDVTGDGNVDLLARDGSGALWRFPGTGTGGFKAPARVPGSWGGYATITGFGDLDRSGGGDLLVRGATGPAYVLPGRGDGTFGKRIGPIGRLKRGTVLGAAQTVGNAAPDVMLARGDDVRVFPHKGTFHTGAPIATGVKLGGIDVLLNVGDWDRDGDGDIITRRGDTGALQLRTGDGNGGFAAPVRIARNFGGVRLLAAVGDMTGDGWPDLMGQPGTGSMRLYPGAGLNGLRASYPAFSRIDGARQLGVGRWDTDGAPDTLVRSADRLRLYQGNGPGGLRSPRQLGLDVSPYDWVVGVSDVRGKGHADVLVRTRASGDLFVIEATANGFKPKRFLGQGMKQYDLVG